MFLLSSFLDRKRQQKVMNSASAVLTSSLNFLDPSVHAPEVNDNIVEEDVLWNIRRLVSRDGRGPSAFPSVKWIFESYNLLVSSEAMSKQKLNIDLWLAKEICKAYKTSLVKLNRGIARIRTHWSSFFKRVMIDYPTTIIVSKSSRSVKIMDKTC